MNKGRHKKLLALFESEGWPELEALSRSFIKSNSKDGIAWKALATALEYQNKDSLPAMQKAIRLLPTDPQVYFNYGNALKWHGQKEQSVVYYKRAVELKPDYAEAWSNLGNALQQTAEPYEALKAYWCGIRLAPHLVNIQLNMGNCYLALGEHARAIRMYNMALEIKPDFIEACNAIIFARDLMPDQTVEGAQKDRSMWNEKFALPLFENRPHENDPSPERRLRIGYVSADFREHSAIRSCGSILVHHDRERFEVFAYDTTRRDPDVYTQMVKDNVDHWQRITDLDDQQVADLIRQDGIDILVDLSGHSGGNRLLAFARKPAPIQLSGWGYATGTGMTAMDGLFSDEILIPPEERHLYAEEIVYLPCVDGPHWVETYPEVSDLPALRQDNAFGIVTFGSLNRMAKVTDATMQLWARVLHAVPNSAFVMKAGEFSEEKPKERVIKQFAELGIEAERLILLGGSCWTEHMEAYRDIDICLDTIPQGGGVTTLEGLMMGVPVVTLRWPTIPGRVSSSILSRTGLSDWITETEDDYVALAVSRVKHLPALAALRLQIRSMFQQTVGDGKAYAWAVEAMYHHLWKRWCGDVKISANENNSKIMLDTEKTACL